jgi:hypothetical protein
VILAQCTFRFSLFCLRLIFSDHSDDVFSFAGLQAGRETGTPFFGIMLFDESHFAS